jgi:benzoyl-CoA reductase subunit D
MPITAGIDVGSGAIKCAIFDVHGDDARPLALQVERLRRRDVKSVIHSTFEAALEEAGVRASDIDYVASTGEGDMVDFRRGHFYSMTTHARGALYLMPEARAVLDIGALHTRAIKMDERSKVLGYRMTSQCASGSGQFLENISRYLGVAIDEIGELSLQSKNPEVVSSICAVLAETDVINMVSRGIATSDILKGIHLSISNRLVRLLRAIHAEEVVALTGGLAGDIGLQATLQERLDADGVPLRVQAHEHSIFAGAIGAALWGAFRHEVLASGAKARVAMVDG